MSRQFVAASSNQLRVLCERRLEDLNLVVLMIDGIHSGGQVLVVGLGIAESGEKHVLRLWPGATENTTVVKGLLEDLVDRGLDLKRRYLVVMVFEPEWSGKRDMGSRNAKRIPSCRLSWWRSWTPVSID